MLNKFVLILTAIWVLLLLFGCAERRYTGGIEVEEAMVSCKKMCYFKKSKVYPYKYDIKKGTCICGSKSIKDIDNKEGL